MTAYYVVVSQQNESGVNQAPGQQTIPRVFEKKIQLDAMLADDLVDTQEEKQQVIDRLDQMLKSDQQSSPERTPSTPDERFDSLLDQESTGETINKLDAMIQI